MRHLRSTSQGDGKKLTAENAEKNTQRARRESQPHNFPITKLLNSYTPQR